MNYRECQHTGGLPAVALAGGDLAAKQPWRNLLAQCLRFVPEWQNYPETASVQQQNWSVLARAIERGINAPLASSCGRLFDAVAAGLGCAPAALSYEGEAACALEALAASCHGVTHPVTMPLVDNQLDLATFWQQWLSWQAPVNQRAWAFHDALAQGFAALMREQATMRVSLRWYLAAELFITVCCVHVWRIILLILRCSSRRVYRRAMVDCLWGRGYCCGALVSG